MRRFAHIVLPLLAFFAALATGAWVSIKQRPAIFSAGVDQQLAATAKGTVTKVSTTPDAFPSETEMLNNLMSALADEEPLRRAHRLHDALGRANSAELAILFQKATQVEDEERRGALLRGLLARWAAIDPEAVDAAVRPYQDRFRKTLRPDWRGRGVDGAVCVAWAAAMPERALTEAMAVPDSQWARDTAWTAIESLTKGDPARQIETLTQFPASRLRAELCESAINALAEKDSAAAEDYLELLPEPRQRTRVQAQILRKLAARDPAAGLERLAALAPNLKGGSDGIVLADVVLCQTAKKDPDAALAAVGDLPEELQTQALGAALVGWAEEHPIEALTWAAANGVELSARSFGGIYDEEMESSSSLIGVALRKDRAKTLAWLHSQPASGKHDSVLIEVMSSGTTEEKCQIYNDLTPGGKATAAIYVVYSGLREGGVPIEEWIKAQPPGTARNAAIQAFVNYHAENAPERIEALADNWPVGAERDAALRGVASYVSESDPRRALDFARRVSAPEVRLATIENIAENWLHRDASTARAWIASTPELSAGEKRVLLWQFDEW